MRIFLRILLSIVFIPLFLIFLIVTSLKFQILNTQYLKSTFIKSDLYQDIDVLSKSIILEQEKKYGLENGELDYIKANLDSSLAQSMIEKNIDGTIGFLSGEGESFNIFIPKELGLPLKNEKILITDYAKDLTSEHLSIIHNLSFYILCGWFVLVVLLMLIIIGHLKLGSFKDKISEIFLISYSILLLIIFLISKKFTEHLRELLVSPQTSEPSQVLIGLLAGSLVPEILNLWIILTVVLLLISLVLLIYKLKFLVYSK